jgi:hypothetical protein
MIGNKKAMSAGTLSKFSAADEVIRDLIRSRKRSQLCSPGNTSELPEDMRSLRISGVPILVVGFGVLRSLCLNHLQVSGGRIRSRSMVEGSD